MGNTASIQPGSLYESVGVHCRIQIHLSLLYLFQCIFHLFPVLEKPCQVFCHLGHSSLFPKHGNHIKTVRLCAVEFT